MSTRRVTCTPRSPSSTTPGRRSGSSNIDPYSLLLAREANVAVYDAAFAHDLRTALESAIDEHSRRVQPQEFAHRRLLRRMVNWIAYGIVRFGAVVLAGGRDY